MASRRVSVEKRGQRQSAALRQARSRRSQATSAVSPLDDSTLRRRRGSRNGTTEATRPGSSAGRMRWAALLQRVFEIDALRCPLCGSTMSLIAVIEDPEVARGILECLKLSARAPPPGDATAAPETPVWPADDWDFDQSPTLDEA